MSIQRDQILKCACELYLREGIEGLSMRRLAGCVGCTAPALYRHYGSKEEVMQDLVGEAYRLFSQYLYRALEAGTPLERFMVAGKSYVDFALEQPALYEIIYVPVEVLGVARHDSPVTSQACAIGRFWSDRVREMIDAGYLKEGDPQAISTTLWGHAHGLISIFHRGLLGALGQEEFREIMTGSFVRMLVGLGTGRFEEALGGWLSSQGHVALRG